MGNIKNLGIWMDHSSAKFIDLSAINRNSTINAIFNFDSKEKSFQNDKNLMYDTALQMHMLDYKDLATIILNYEHVLLFGPTNAKLELHNYLNQDSHFKDIKIDIETADFMTDREKKVFVKQYFYRLTRKKQKNIWVLIEGLSSFEIA